MMNRLSLCTLLLATAVSSSCVSRLEKAEVDAINIGSNAKDIRTLVRILPMSYLTTKENIALGVPPKDAYACTYSMTINTKGKSFDAKKNLQIIDSFGGSMKLVTGKSGLNRQVRMNALLEEMKVEARKQGADRSTEETGAFTFLAGFGSFTVGLPLANPFMLGGGAAMMAAGIKGGGPVEKHLVKPLKKLCSQIEVAKSNDKTKNQDISLTEPPRWFALRKKTLLTTIVNNAVDALAKEGETQNINFSEPAVYCPETLEAALDMVNQCENPDVQKALEGDFNQ